MRTSSGSMATISVNDSRTVDLRKDPSVTRGKEAIEMTDLPKLELSPHDKAFSFTASKTRGFVRVVKSLKMEMLTFVYIFSYAMRSVTSVTMIMHKTCRVNIGFSEEICDHLNLDKYKAEKMQVETMTNNYHLGHTLLSIGPSAFLSMLIGPWSDMYGRKPPIIAGELGIIFHGIGEIFCAYFLDTHAEYYLLPAIFVGISGGFISVFTTVYSYVSDVSTREDRTLRYTLLELSLGLGAPLGALAGGYIYLYSGYIAVFATALSGHIFGIFWIIFVIEETRGLNKHDPWEVQVRNFFSMDRLRESFKSCAKPRPHRGRAQIWLMLLTMSLGIVAMAGTMSISYIFVYHHYGWDNTKYSTVTAIFSMMGLVAMLIAVPLLTKLLKLGDPSLGVIGSVSVVLKYVGTGVAVKEGVYYFANLLGLLSPLASLASRTRVSKIVSKDELGKVFAFLSTVESLVPILVSVVVTQVFNKTVGMFPDPSYMGVGALSVISIVVFVWLACLPSVNYEEMQDSTKEEEEEVKENSKEEKDDYTESKNQELSTSI